LILLTHLNGKSLYVNPNLIEILESTPDTVITLTTGKKLIVRESPAVVVQKFTDFAARTARVVSGTREEAPWT
jgi:flagellar protein FlbD